MANEKERKIERLLNEQLRDAVQDRAERMPAPRFDEVYESEDRPIGSRMALLRIAAVLVLVSMFGFAGYRIYRFRQERVFLKEGIEFFLGSLYRPEDYYEEVGLSMLPPDPMGDVRVDDPVLQNVENIFNSWNLP